MLLRNIILPFRHPSYILLMSGVTWLVFSVAVWLANIQLIWTFFRSDLFSVFDKLTLLFTLYASIGTNFNTFSASTTIAVAVLFGVQVSLLWYYIRRRQGGSGVAEATSLGGIISGFFGIGCANCGTLIITSLLSLFGASGSLALLPFGGQEFGLIGVGLLLYSIYILAKRLHEPIVCDVA